MTNAQASVAQWKAFYNTIYNAVLVGEVCKAHSKDVKFFQQVADCLCDSIYIMSHCINRTMDFDASAVQKRVVIKSGISDDLDQLKQKHSSLLEVMSQVAEQELQQLPDFVESCSMVYIPEAGYMLAIPYWDTDLTEEQLQSMPNLQFKFKTTDIVHYKSARCYGEYHCAISRELDSLLGDVQLKVIEIESRIVLKLVQYIQRNIAPLVQLTSLIAELDCLLALTQSARDYNLVRPTLTKDKQIHITKGRHILQELCVDVFVPNDTNSNEEHGFVKILSGPNASGKSVYLKQVALIVYLAHVGSFVPSEHATIGILDEIHTRVQTVESISTHLSAFMLDLRQMSLALRNSSSNSLVLVDEFGKGTTEIDGLGILSACLEHFIERGNDCPHLFVSTHFHSLPKMLPTSPAVKVQLGVELARPILLAIRVARTSNDEANNGLSEDVARPVLLTIRPQGVN
ncbi:MutS protein msh5 [Homalodisca vitripennis]|nr:MutS protein msh5 [Homalodisca vitripennis]